MITGQQVAIFQFYSIIGVGGIGNLLAKRYWAGILQFILVLFAYILIISGICIMVIAVCYSIPHTNNKMNYMHLSGELILLIGIGIYFPSVIWNLVDAFLYYMHALPVNS